MSENTITTTYLNGLIRDAIVELEGVGANHLSPFSLGIQLHHLSANRETAVARFFAGIGADESFGKLREGWITTPQSGGVLQSHMLPSYIIRTVLDGIDLSTTLQSLRNFAATGSTGFEWYAPLAGITVADVIHLAENISIVPWAQVPACSQRTVFEPNLNEIPTRPPAFVSSPSSAIRVVLPERQILFSSNADAGELTALEQTEVYEIANDIVLVSALTAGTTSAILGSWFYASDLGARAFTSSVYGWTHALTDMEMFGAIHKPTPVDAIELRKIFENFGKLTARDRDSLRVAIHRLNLSMRRAQPVDKAIDLGIAMEATLLHDQDGKTELRYRCALRGATYLGGNNDERLSNLKLLVEGYDTRSSAVHSGSISSPGAVQILTDNTILIIRVIKKIISEGEFPNWNRLIVGSD